jgi:hypothetical protein
VGLAPLVLLTLILLAAAVLIAVGSAFTATVLSAVALNVAAAMDDMFIAYEVLSYPSETYFEDTGYGFITYGRAET